MKQRLDILNALKLLFDADDRIQIHVDHCSIGRQADGNLRLFVDYGQQGWDDCGIDFEIITKFMKETGLGFDIVSLEWVKRQKATIDRHYEEKDNEAAESVYRAASKRIMIALAEGKLENPVEAVRIITGDGDKK